MARSSAPLTLDYSQGNLPKKRMQPITILGFVAGTLTTLSFVPQVHKAWATKRCDDLSLGMLLAFGSGVALWMVYGIVLRAVPIIAANLVTLALIIALLFLKVRYRANSKPNVAVNSSVS